MADFENNKKSIISEPKKRTFSFVFNGTSMYLDEGNPLSTEVSNNLQSAINETRARAEQDDIAPELKERYLDGISFLEGFLPKKD